MDFYNLFSTYDRILSLDSDIIITPTCPNIFNTVPEDHVGTIFEDRGSRMAARRNTIQEVQKEWGSLKWNINYMNTGVAVFSKVHKPIFQPFKNKYWLGWGVDDVHLGYMLRVCDFPIYELPFQFNHMSMFSEPWNGSADKYKSYIIHYAGGRMKDRIKTIKDDVEKIYGSSL